MTGDEARTAGVEDGPAPADGVVDIGAFCRQVEGHLCRANGGHLIRIVGPAFELVAGWAREGLPLRLVLHGIDRTIARLTARGPRRRPVRIEFCEADVRDACDQWRRAVGAHALQAGPRPGDAPAVPASRVPPLSRHVERVLLRLSSIGATSALPAALAAAVSQSITDVDRCLDASRGARGEARTAVLERLVAIDGDLTEAAITSLSVDDRRRLDEQVERELAPFRVQMPQEALRDARAALLRELARRHFSLPQVRLDG